MSVQRKSYSQLDAEIQALINKKNALIDESATLFCKSVLTKENKNKIAELKSDEIKLVGKKVAASIDDIIKSVRKQADDKDVLRPESAKSAPRTEPVKYKFDVPSAAKKPATDARPSGVPSPVTGAGNSHQD